MNNRQQLNRKFHAMITFTFENLPDKYAGNYPSPEHLKEELIKRAGFYHGYTNMKGDKIYFAESVSGISSQRYQKIYEGVYEVINTKIAPLCGEDFTKELSKFK